MSSDWCTGIEKRLEMVESAINKVEESNNNLVKIVVIGLLTIVGAVVGVKLF